MELRQLQSPLSSFSLCQPLPLIPFFPFVRMLFQFDVNAPDLLCNLSYSPSGGVQRMMSWVIVRQLQAKFLHVPHALLA